MTELCDWTKIPEKKQNLKKNEKIMRIWTSIAYITNNNTCNEFMEKISDSTYRSSLFL